MSERPKVDESDSRSFSLWFYLFAVLTLILVAKDRGLSIESAHSLIMMLFFRQMGIVWNNEQEKDRHETEVHWLYTEIKELRERVQKIDPYSEE